MEKIKINPIKVLINPFRCLVSFSLGVAYLDALHRGSYMWIVYSLIMSLYLFFILSKSLQEQKEVVKNKH